MSWFRKFFDSLRRPKNLVLTALAGLLILLIFAHVSHRKSPKPKRGENDPPDYSGITVDHVVKIIQKRGRGPLIESRDRVKLRYRMWVYDPTALGNHGKGIAAETDHEMEVLVGEASLIRGWSEALIGMQAGEASTLLIPSKLAYGDRGAPPRVPPGAIVQISNAVIEIKKSDQQ